MPLDKEQFLSQPTEGAFATTFVPVPEDEYLAKAVTVDMNESFNPDKGWACWMDINYEIVDEAKLKKVQEITGKDKPQVRQRIFLDVTRDENDKVTGFRGGDKSNQGLGQLREAAGQNDPKRRWAPGNLIGSVVRIKAVKETYNDRIMTNVAFMGVTKAKA